jgi:hypothetical protein
MRVVGLVATGILLAAGIAMATMVLDRHHTLATPTDEPAPAATPAATGHHHAKAKTAPARPHLTAAQRKERAAAVHTLSGQGYKPVRLADYGPSHVLRVLVGRGATGERAFFFVGGRFIGNDAADDSAHVTVQRAGNRSVALSYRLFKPGDKACCPSGGRTRVLFRWDGTGLAPMTAIPPAAARRAPAA